MTFYSITGLVDTIRNALTPELQPGKIRKRHAREHCSLEYSALSQIGNS